MVESGVKHHKPKQNVSRNAGKYFLVLTIIFHTTALIYQNFHSVEEWRVPLVSSGNSVAF
jgi:hypothetical protein